MFAVDMNGDGDVEVLSDYENDQRSRGMKTSTAVASASAHT